MSIVMYEYPKCGTCRNAVKYLQQHGVSFEDHHIVETPPSIEQLRQMVNISGLPIQKFFNASGKKYRELGLSQKLKEMTDDEKLALLASDGMLIKRPLVTDGKKVTVGFKEDEFETNWGSQK
ncbi:arsenate reductase [Thermoactinomyces sp. DSM 45891]|uniref:arsenate reductase family protein n=1 Tax=Thermoactinomyces sp. DSM 45891 TaxID=1761907 RepID=UPI00092055D0|nr:arsenate reductase family protein [Thermoactinomyces sp. DSM 45891]SFX18439.1 arsenate reductase [Thermoactinomyces sp. DSM 45891]